MLCRFGAKTIQGACCALMSKQSMCTFQVSCTGDPTNFPYSVLWRAELLLTEVWATHLFARDLCCFCCCTAATRCIELGIAELMYWTPEYVTAVLAKRYLQLVACLHRLLLSLNQHRLSRKSATLTSMRIFLMKCWDRPLKHVPYHQNV
jgi:hypothetical protein